MPQTQDIRLVNIVDSVDKDRLVIPDFQRGFKWRGNDIRKLLESLLLNYPIGAALFWRTQRSHLIFRRVEDVDLADSTDDDSTAPSESDGNPNEEIDFILDGQQRITSIYKIFPKSIAPTDLEMGKLKGLRFFLDLPKLGLPTSLEQLATTSFEKFADPDVVDAAIVEKTHPELRKEYRKLSDSPAPHKLTSNQILEICNKNLWLPLTRDFLDNKLTIAYKLRAEAQHRLNLELAQEDGKTSLTKGQELETAFDRWMDWFTSTFVSKLNSKTLPVLLVHNESTDGLARIFETINSTGMTLSVFDLLVARMGTWKTSTGEINLRTLISSEVPATYLKLFDDVKSLGGTASQQMPRAFALRAGIELKKGEILKANRSKFLDHKDEMGIALRFSLETLHLRMGVVDESFLPFKDAISLLAAFYRENISPEQVDGAIALIWTASLIEDWDNSTNDKTRSWFKYFDQILKHTFDPIQMITRLVTDFPSFEDIRDSATKGTLYRTILAFNLSRGGLDWDLNERLPSKDLEDHHIFPRNWIHDNRSEQESKTDWIARRDSILNRILVSKSANRKIKAQAPQVYLSAMSPTERRLAQIPEEFLGPLSAPVSLEVFSSVLKFRYDLVKDDLIDDITKKLQSVK